MSISKEYAAAMMRGDTTACVQIEEKYNLYGLSPEFVSVGLNAVDAGQDHQEAITDYMIAQSAAKGGA